MKDTSFAAALVFSFLVTFAVGDSWAQPITPSPTWKNSISGESDPFVMSPFDNPEPSWVKFTILLSQPNVVYFQDGHVYRFHYDFARARLDPYLNITRAQYDAITLNATGQQMVLGAVLFPPWNHPAVGGEIAVQLVRNDAYTREQARNFINLVVSKVTGAPGRRVLYMPTFEQAEAAQSQAAWFATQNITVASALTWAVGDAAYSEGWAMGELKFVAAAQIQAAYNAGTLRPDHILLTDAIPAEVPFVAGIVSLSPSTPNSHVAILSQTYSVPFVFLADEDARARAQAMVGRRALLRSYLQFGRPDVRLVEVPAAITPQQYNQILAMKTPAPLQYQPMASQARYSINTDTLHSSDIRYVGGKAANYGVLRRAIPGNSVVRPAAALTFDVWNQYMSQTLTNGRTLRQEIHARLYAHSWPPNFAALTTDLADVRALFTSTSQTNFSPALQTAILATLQDPQYGFDPFQKIRFRSSTNVEDSAQFTGAGLYDSFSGCLRDDLDGDTVGPSVCEPSEPNERGVFRAIRRVFASFYNDNAYIQRLRLGVDEDQVGMGVLVHHSFPDEIEMANGVAILSRNGSATDITIVTQTGATSVTNPDGGSIPEEVYIYSSTFGMYPILVRSSNLVLLGDTVMTWENDYTTLGAHLVAAADRFAQENGLTGRYTLDYEFKKVAPAGTIEVKQIRQIPEPATTPSVVPWLLGAPRELCLYQGEGASVFANHRLKTRLALTPDTRLLDAAGRTRTLYTNMTLPFLDGCAVDLMSGNPANFYNALFSYSSGATMDQWGIIGIPNPRSYAFITPNIPTLVAPSQSPVLTADDLGQNTFFELRVVHRFPVPTLDWTNQPTTTTFEGVRLCPCDRFSRLGGRNNHILGAPGGVTIDTAFWYTRHPGGVVAGYTADLAKWDRTIITGLTSEPIVLRSEWSQTFVPGHHNFAEWFIFDPRQEPGIPAHQLAELQRRGIAYIYAETPNFDEPRVIYYSDTGCPLPCSADFNNDGDVGTDADIEAFFACVSGSCCATCADADFDNDGDTGTDADIEAFFRVLGGGAC